MNLQKIKNNQAAVLKEDKYYFITVVYLFYVSVTGRILV